MNDYIAELRTYLNDLNPTDQDDIIQFYTNYLRDGGFNAYVDCVDELGSPKELSQNILSDYANKGEKIHRKKSKSHAWIAILILAIISLPITIPLTIGIFFGLFGILIGIIIGVFTLIVVAFALLVLGVVLFFHNPAVGMFYSAGGLIVLGAFILAFTLIQWGVKWLIYGIQVLAKKISNYINQKKGGRK